MNSRSTVARVARNLAISAIFILVTSGTPLDAIGRGLASASPALSATPGPGAMSVYTITNPNAAPLNVQEGFTNSSGFSYTAWIQVSAQSSATIHVRDISQIPSPFIGQVSLHGDAPFTAQITGYDYPPTPTSTPPPSTRTPGATSTPLQSTPTPGAGATPSPTATAAPLIRPNPQPSPRAYLPVVTR